METDIKSLWTRHEELAEELREKPFDRCGGNTHDKERSALLAEYWQIDDQVKRAVNAPPCLFHFRQDNLIDDIVGIDTDEATAASAKEQAASVSVPKRRQRSHST